MSRRDRKAQVNQMDLVMLALVFFIGLALFMLADFLATSDLIVSKQTIYLSMQVDDGGSELVSVLGATSQGRSNMRLMGDSLASNSNDVLAPGLGEFQDSVKKLGPSYSLTFSSVSTGDTPSGSDSEDTEVYQTQIPVPGAHESNIRNVVELKK